MQNNDIVVQSSRFVALVLLQVLVLNNINLFGYVNPYLYIFFIVLFPFGANKSLLLLLSFFLGLSIDIFSNSGGIHAAACLVIAQLRPLLLKFSFGISYEYNSVKLNKTPFNKRLLYILLMVLIHHAILFSLEIFNVSNILLILKSTFFSGAFTSILIVCTLLLFGRKIN